MNNLLISDNETILDALKKLNIITDISRLVLFVYDKDQKVVGSLTDGDIRRSLAKDRSLEKKAGEVCNRDFIFLFETSEFVDLEEIKNKNIKILPLLNQNKTLSRIIDLEKKKSLVPLECVIMAGGRGKRLSPLTDTVPKPMLPLGNKPIIEYNIDRLISYGVEKIYISVRYLGEQIQEYFGDGSSKGIKIEYVWEDKPLGTAGAISLIKDIQTEHVLLMNSDLFTNVNISEMFKTLVDKRLDMVIASTEYKVDIPYAVFENDDENNVSFFEEKPTYVYHSNAGVYLFKTELISKIPQDTFYDITDLMNKLLDEGHKLMHHPIRGYWIDIGKSTDYKKAEALIKYMN
jgi:dTDP-glucose pyrophosphorylase